MNSIGPNNISRTTLDRTKIQLDAHIEMWSATDGLSNYKLNSHDFFEHPIVQAATLQVPPRDGAEYKVKWSARLLANTGAVARFQIVPFAGDRLLFGGTDIFAHRHPYSQNGSIQNPDNDDKYFTLWGESTFALSGTSVDVGLYGIGSSAFNTFSNAQVTAYDIQLTLRKCR